MERPDTKYQITEKGQQLADKLGSTRGVQNMMSNPIMSSMKQNPKRAQSQSKTTSEDNENRIKKIPNKDPNFTTMSPGRVRPLKVRDSSADILAKMYNLMVKKDLEEKKENKENKKYIKNISNLKNERNKELIGLFKVKKTEKIEKGTTSKLKTKEPAEKKESSNSKAVTKPIEKMTAKGEVSTNAAKVEKTVAEKVTAPSASKVVSNAAPSAVSKVVTRGAVGAAVVGGALSGTAASVIAKEEGLPAKGKAYYDPPSQKQLVSIGYGHQITNEEYKQGFIQAGEEQISIRGERGIDTVMNPAQSQKVLQQDLPKYEKRAADPLGGSWSKLNENQKAALTSYAYNTGSTSSLVKAGLKTAIDSGNMKEAADIIRNKGIRTAGGQFNKTLDARRRKEADLFESESKSKPTETASLNSSNANIESSPIPEKMKKNSSKTKATNISVLNTNINKVDGGTTYSSGEDKKEYSPLMEKQFNYN
jgi:GH24 family phage-related lysozyme (muramidase)